MIRIEKGRECFIVRYQVSGTEEIEAAKTPAQLGRIVKALAERWGDLGEADPDFEVNER